MLTMPFGWSVNKFLLVIGNILAGSALIILSHTNVLPLDPVNFLFFSFVGFLCALYRPGWAFLFLVGMLPYEIVTLAPSSFGVSIRPYQWVLVLVTLALAVRLALKRFPVEKFAPNVWDIALLVFGASAFLSALASGDQATAMKMSVILASFILLYFITRIFVRSADDARMLVPFLFSSLLVIAGYAIVQNILFMNGRESFAVMAGRPNAVFSEADWLGGYLAVMVTLLAALIAAPRLVERYAAFRPTRLIFSGLLFVGFVALIITVSRSAWLAAFAGIAIVLFTFAWQTDVWKMLKRRERYALRAVAETKLFILVPLLLAVSAVALFDLSPFDLLDRTKSVSSGEQKIAIACQTKQELPEKIASLEMLMQYGCEHIALEDRAAQEAAGAYVTEIFRDDPNVSIRQDIYGKVISILKERWFAGIGFGVISEYLGTDGRGAGLNASNIFLEVWLGSGIIGLIAFVVFWFGRGWRSLLSSFKDRAPLGLILLALFISVTTFNLFNSGLFLGWFFVLLAFLMIAPDNTYDSK
ncbi:MAG: hypothetical protein A3E38_01205 [Candidatus Moranbacteria bacterium RIFCSPHIGHO2_12_FULL_54_9]|nr:MAG: hypothetical protein A2878_02060 [Candidatus Moranbacteria bacterium RIFCSPHIGHO2_01_FULL_54_31]OGI25400.1 MAG: hypothetical protein A3E38_01205 [Candidatus Moranbacteria bacterium RIFCSPHIGHO2_12_FULL_54_9]